MKYVSIDIETTGLDPKLDQVLEMAAIVEDTEEKLKYSIAPKFRALFVYDRMEGRGHTRR